MVTRYRVKVTVLKRMKPSEVFETLPATEIWGENEEPWDACKRFKDGEEFLVEWEKMPEGFCATAWHCIHPNIRILGYGWNLDYEEDGVSIVCCNDGLRPVIFKLERQEAMDIENQKWD